jgi:hypothetical protein
LIEPFEEPFERKSPSEFAKWFSLFPKKTHELEAEKEYGRIIKKRLATHDQLDAGAIRYAAETANTEPKYIVNPKKWLAGHRWKDAPAAISQSIATRSRADSAVDGMRG